MPAEDRQRWNDKYRAGDHASSQPSQVFVSLKDHLPTAGRALDVAGGAGRHAIWLARRGLDVTLADISDVGLARATARAAEANVRLETQQIDLEVEQLPSGPWDVILSVHFISRPLFDQFASRLSPQGLLIVIHPTRSNLGRHDKPSARFLLDDGELPNLLNGLEVVHYEEGWLADGLHEAVAIARRP